MSRAPSAPTHQPQLVIVMGVSGSGKSSVAKAMAEQLNYEYLDADDFHSDEAKACMAAGVPLTDAQRIPWVHNICAHLATRAQNGQNCTLAFSGLRRSHRQQLRKLPFDLVFLYLKGSKALIAERINARNNHFMPPSLLDSQFASMEESTTETDVISIDIDRPLSQVVESCIEQACSRV
ncbi:gluconokinase [Gilvimarinus sp. DA14]|uniref:gluconokinase n=1 Tax=Gilvimarinus sp. DA14 TaxID=2956798 RepID=UPI0020B63EBF|nr:gluconokinase [Gilvimarinus sp. DA14]UTF59993.1 gluconokinase [Gilvimarinus sp. DA14]